MLKGPRNREYDFFCFAVVLSLMNMFVCAVLVFGFLLCL